MALSDHFTRANGGLGADWTNQVGTPQISGNAAVGSAAGNYSSAFWASHTFNNAQSSAITKSTTSSFIAPAVRQSGTGGSANWYAYYDDGSVEKMVGGAPSTIASRSAYTVGQEAILDVTGTTITLSINGVPDAGGTVTDSSLASGAAGIVFFDTTGTLDDWVGTGEIAAQAGSPRFLLMRH